MHLPTDVRHGPFPLVAHNIQIAQYMRPIESRNLMAVSLNGLEGQHCPE
ncbi:hypothetical protein [Yersinia enterocolitica]|nr:hypothetical protein [Yersinia enterocolitica]